MTYVPKESDNMANDNVEAIRCVKCHRALRVGDVVYKLCRGTLQGNYTYIPITPDYDQYYIELAMCEKCVGVLTLAEG